MVRTRREPSRSREPTVQATASRPTRPTRRQASADLPIGTEGSDGQMQPLGPVHEDDGDDGPSFAPLNDAPSHDGEASRLARGSVYSQGAPSQFSAVTSFSQEQLRSLNPHSILGAIEDLDRASDAILKDVVPPHFEDLSGIVDSLLDPQSPLRKKLQARFDAFQALKPYFGDEASINPELILRFLLQLPPKQELLPTLWRPDDIFYKANLTQFVLDIFKDQDALRLLEVLTSLDYSIPGFAAAQMINPKQFRALSGQSQLVKLTFDLAVETRTQFFIYSLMQSDDPPMTVLQNVFLGGDEVNGVHFEHEVEPVALRPWSATITDTSDTDSWRALCARFLEIRADVENTDDRHKILQRLQVLHPWPDFCIKLLSWTQQRWQELNHIINERGGASKIEAALEQEVGQLNANTDPQLLPASSVNSRSLATRDNMNKLRERRHRNQNQLPEIAAAAFSESTNLAQLVAAAAGKESVPANAGYTQPDAAPDQDFFAGAESTPVDQPAQAQLNRIRGNNEMDIANKENQTRFIDEQPGAPRIDFDSQLSSDDHHGTASGLHPVTLNSSASNRRSHSAMEDDDHDGHDGFEPTPAGSFQNDPRVHGAPRQQAPRATMVPPRRTRPRAWDAQDVSHGRSSERERQNPGQAIDSLPPPTLNADGLPSPTQIEIYRNANLLAKTVSSQQHKQARARTKFSGEEDLAVLDYVGQFGAAWTSIKKADDAGERLLEQRTAEDIRLKARNMKMDYLKARMDLPEGFEGVQITRKELTKLAELGIPYSQTAIRAARHAGLPGPQ